MPRPRLAALSLLFLAPAASSRPADRYVPNGRASALEIRGGTFTAIDEDGRQVVAGPGAPALAR